MHKSVQKSLGDLSQVLYIDTVRYIWIQPGGVRMQARRVCKQVTPGGAAERRQSDERLPQVPRAVMSTPALGEGKTINLSTSKIGVVLEFSEKDRGSALPAGNRSGGPNLEIRERPIVGTNVQPPAVRNLLSREEQERLLHNATTLVYRRNGTTVF